MRPHDPVPLSRVYAARRRLEGTVPRTPLVPLSVDAAPARIYLKLENLQPIGSFKLRGAGNAMLEAGGAALAQGVYTASAGNMAQGVAWFARRLGVPCVAVVPDHAPQTKRAAIQRLGAEVVAVPAEEWLRVMTTHGDARFPGRFIHPFSDPAVMAGNGTVGLEILEDLPEVDAIVVPYGGGGLSCGIAAAVKALRPRVRVFACEVATAAPLAASLAAGAPRPVPYAPSFVDGIGAPAVFPEMWPLASRLLDGSLVVTLDEVAAAIRVLATHSHVIAEGAGAAPVAAALAGRAGPGTVVCVVSGGNIDPGVLAAILAGGVP